VGQNGEPTGGQSVSKQDEVNCEALDWDGATRGKSGVLIRPGINRKPWGGLPRGTGQQGQGRGRYRTING